METTENKEADSTSDKSEKLFFAMIGLPSGETVVGTLSERCLANWVLNKAKLVVKNPKKLSVSPKVENQRIVGYNVGILPTLPIKTPQDRITYDAASVEVIEEIYKDTEGNETCNDHSGLYSSYLDVITQWRMELSGLVCANGPIPTGSEPSQGNVHNLFPGKKGHK